MWILEVCKRRNRKNDDRYYGSDEPLLEEYSVDEL